MESSSNDRKATLIGGKPRWHETMGQHYPQHWINCHISPCLYKDTATIEGFQVCRSSQNALNMSWLTPPTSTAFSLTYFDTKWWFCICILLRWSCTELCTKINLLSLSQWLCWACSYDLGRSEPLMADQNAVLPEEIHQKLYWLCSYNQLYHNVWQMPAYKLVVTICVVFAHTCTCSHVGMLAWVWHVTVSVHVCV